MNATYIIKAQKHLWMEYTPALGQWLPLGRKMTDTVAVTFHCNFFFNLLLSHRCSLHVLFINPIADRWFENISCYFQVAFSFCWQFSWLCSFLLWCSLTCLYLLCFWCHLQEVITKTNAMKLFLYIFFSEFYSFRLCVGEVLFIWKFSFPLHFYCKLEVYETLMFTKQSYV
jgi:hypothetical protein